MRPLLVALWLALGPLSGYLLCLRAGSFGGADVFTLGLIAGFGAGALVALMWAAMVPPPKRRAL